MLYCFDPRHETPCPNPEACAACQEECDPTLWQHGPDVVDPIEQIQDVGKRIHTFMEALPPDSPARAMAFKLCALTGEIEAAIKASVIARKDK